MTSEQQATLAMNRMREQVDDIRFNVRISFMLGFCAGLAMAGIILFFRFFVTHP